VESGNGRSIDSDPNLADNLGNFAVFLETRRQDYDRAEALYERAIGGESTSDQDPGN
jgi:protein O-mannosyl-transferase